MRPADFDRRELARGTRHEMEHTDSRKVAQRIAMDHLAEDPRYYSRLSAAGINPRKPASPTGIARARRAIPTDTAKARKPAEIRRARARQAKPTETKARTSSTRAPKRRKRKRAAGTTTTTTTRTTTTRKVKRTIRPNARNNPSVQRGELQSIAVRGDHPDAGTRAGLRRIVERHGGTDRGYDAEAARDGVTVYRFRQRDPARFVRGTFRTAKISRHVSLVYAVPKRRNARAPVVRLNPGPDLELRPRWQPLRTAGEMNLAIREQVRGKTGVYQMREAGGPILYIGETHEAHPTELRRPKRRKGERKRPPPERRPQPLRWWKTILRHLYPWAWKYDPRDPRYADPAKRPDEWTHLGKHDLEISIHPTPAHEARTAEGAIVMEAQRRTGGREPLHVRKAYVSEAELRELEDAGELEDAPF